MQAMLLHSLLIAGPTVEPTMRVTILSSRDTVPNVVFTLSFNVTFGPASNVKCYYNNVFFLSFVARDDHPNLSREVIRSKYVNNLQPDMTLVTAKIDQPVREERLYRCEVVAEGRVGIVSGTYSHLQKGPVRTSTVTITGE